MSRIVFRTNAFLSMKLIAVDILMRRACSECYFSFVSHSPPEQSVNDTATEVSDLPNSYQNQGLNR